jgi:mono/diheme cytochrome c family protein
MRAAWVWGVGLAAVVIAGYSLYGGKGDGAGGTAGAAIVEVQVPVLEGDAALGELAFTAKCAACHGKHAGGINGAGPPLVHSIYEPGHHGDMAFYLAARNGVRSHHWRFGDMPPVEGVNDTQIGRIVAFVRALQRENGIN